MESGRRSAARAPATGSGRRIIPAPPPYGASSTLRWRPRPQVRRSWTRTVASPCSWIRPGMLAASGPATISGKRVTISISRATGQPSAVGAVGRVRRGAPGVRGGLPGGRDRRATARGSAGPGRPWRRRGAHLVEGRQVERLWVGNDLAAARRQDPDERPDDGQVEVAARPADDLEDVGAARAVDVAHGAESAARRVANLDPDHLVPEVRAAWQGVGRARLHLEIDEPQAIGGFARGHLAEAQDPARVGRPRFDDRERLGAPSR